jgi:hypothetical protein
LIAAIALGALLGTGIFAAFVASQLAARKARAAGAWLRQDHPPLGGDARAELALVVREQADRVRAALEPLPRSTGVGIGAALEVAAGRLDPNYHVRHHA